MPKICKHNDCNYNVWGKGYCKYHQYLRDDKKKTSSIKKSKIKKGYKRTGELEVFKEIWEERPRICFVSGEAIKGFNVQCFAHVLPKGSFPTLRLEKYNIVLLTPEMHFMYDHEVHKAKKLPQFDKLFELRERLQANYYTENKIVRFD